MSYEIDITQEPEYSLTITGDCPDYAITFEMEDGDYDVEVSEVVLTSGETDPVFTAWLATDPFDDYVESDDSRLTDSRTPTSHGNEAHDETYLTAATLPVPSVTLGDYFYMAASETADTANDWRIYADASGMYFQFCTVGNATKGGGTWVTKFTTQV